MTISSEVRKAGPFSGNDVTTEFSFLFKVFADAEVLAVSADAQGTESALVLGIDYTVTLNANQNTTPGGKVTLTSPLATGYTLVLTSQVENLQPADLTNNGGFYPSVINAALDRATIQIQQIKEQVDRSAKLPITSAADAASLVDDLIRVADSIANVDAVAGSISSVNTVASNIGDVATVASNIADVTNFSDVYLGGKASDPTARNDGSALQNGDLYFNTATGKLKVYSASDVAWREGYGYADLVSYTPSGTGAVPTNVQAKLREFVSVKDFGAVGDGVTDDTAAFAAAMKAGVAVYVPPASPVGGDKPQVPYIVEQLRIPNGCTIFGDFGATYIKQKAGANKDFVVRDNDNVCFFSIENLVLDGNKANNTTGHGIWIGGTQNNFTPYNHWGANDPYFRIKNVFIVNTAEDGLRISASRSVDGTSTRGGGAVIENVSTLFAGGRGMYFALFDAHLSSLDAGASGKEAIVFDPACGSLHVNRVKGWYSGQSVPTSGSAVVLGGGYSEYTNIKAQAAIPGNGIVCKTLYNSTVDGAVVQGAGSQAGFGSTPSQFVFDGCTRVKFRGVAGCAQGEPVAGLNLVSFAGSNNHLDVDLTYSSPSSGSYTNVVSGSLYPIQGGAVVNSLRLNNSQQMGYAFAPVYAAAQNPDVGWYLLSDASNGNALTAWSSGGVKIPLTPREYSISSLPSPSLAIKGAKAYVVNGVSSPALGSIPSTTGSTYCPVYCDGVNWRYG